MNCQTIRVKQTGTRKFEAWIRFGRKSSWQLLGCFISYKEAVRQAKLALYASTPCKNPSNVKVWTGRL